MKNLYQRTTIKLIQTPIVMGVLLFLPAGTFHYWEAWVFISVFFTCTLAITVFLAIKNPTLLERRLNAGPTAEKERAQKKIMLLMLFSFAAMIMVPAVDHRLGWSNVPEFIVILGNILIIFGFIAVSFVMKANVFAASTIEISKGQRVISTGPYSIVRHPMYAGALILLLGIPLSLGSWWGLLVLIPNVAGIIWRLLDEENFLNKNLPGYLEYTRQVHYRLIPFLW